MRLSLENSREGRHVNVFFRFLKISFTQSVAYDVDREARLPAIFWMTRLDVFVRWDKDGQSIIREKGIAL
jgi:hypothetical protein